jgi:hypothetical protein
MPLYPGPKNKPSKKLVTCFLLVSCLAYSSTLKAEATLGSEVSASLRVTRRYNLKTVFFIVAAVKTSNPKRKMSLNERILERTKTWKSVPTGSKTRNGCTENGQQQMTAQYREHVNTEMMNLRVL